MHQWVSVDKIVKYYSILGNILVKLAVEGKLASIAHFYHYFTSHHYILVTFSHQISFHLHSFKSHHLSKLCWKYFLLFCEYTTPNIYFGDSFLVGSISVLVYTLLLVATRALASIIITQQVFGAVAGELKSSKYL